MIRTLSFLITMAVCLPTSAETLKVLALPSEPFLFDRGGEPAGIEYEILDYFAKARGDELEVEFVPGFADLLERIAAGEGDIASGTITITEERRTRMDFSAPYFPVQIVLVERLGEGSRELRDLAGTKVAAFTQTTAEDALREIGGVEIVQRTGVEGMLDAVKNREIQAAAADSSAVIPVLDDYPSLAITLYFGEEQDFGFALPKGSPLTAPLSEHIQRLKESGIYFRLMTEYMGEEATAIVRAAKR